MATWHNPSGRMNLRCFTWRAFASLESPFLWLSIAHKDRLSMQLRATSSLVVKVIIFGGHDVDIQDLHQTAQRVFVGRWLPEEVLIFTSADGSIFSQPGSRHTQHCRFMGDPRPLNQLPLHIPDRARDRDSSPNTRHILHRPPNRRRSGPVQQPEHDQRHGSTDPNRRRNGKIPLHPSWRWRCATGRGHRRGGGGSRGAALHSQGAD
ncbi:hypothetical protein BDW59DRAFT_83794 [Aspergillus cavernicola]|uniref:Uncharacterized protein n=1 Tax=Aspergillus cavernicola TaxID=176166 RepID=A0ABR4IA61_9EURO